MKTGKHKRKKNDCALSPPHVSFGLQPTFFDKSEVEQNDNSPRFHICNILFDLCVWICFFVVIIIYFIFYYWIKNVMVMVL